MKKTITLNGREMTFKSSAATNILYKKAFHDDILVKLTAYSKNLKELKQMQARIAELKEDKTTTQEVLLAEMNNMIQSDVFQASQIFTNETLPRLAYIMWVEANESQETIFGKLNDENYLFWLMDFDQDELLSVTGEIMELWQAGAKTTSKPKN